MYLYTANWIFTIIHLLSLLLIDCIGINRAMVSIAAFMYFHCLPGHFLQTFSELVFIDLLRIVWNYRENQLC